MSFLLHHTRITASDAAQPVQWLIMLHGAFGSGRNWVTVARGFVTRRPQWGVLLVDLREHGHSLNAPPPHTLAAAADDIARLVQHLQLEVPAILGHSLGGKVAMQYVAREKHGILQHAFIIDSTPDAYSPSGDAWQMLQLLRRLPARFATRADAMAALRNEGLSEPVAQWIAMNVHADEQGDYRLRLNLDNMESLLRDFYRSDYWPLIESPPPGLDLHILRATRSSIITGAAARRIAAAAQHNPRIHLHEIESGHWLNLDNPAAIINLLATTLI